MQEAIDYISLQTSREPRIAVVLGSGLNAFADELGDTIEIPYSKIPEWPASTAAAKPRPRCLRCGMEVRPRNRGCKNPCANCGCTYPLGDCSD